MQPLRVLESCLYAIDLFAAERFYTQVIGLVKHAPEDGRHVFFRCGGDMVLVFNPEHTCNVATTVAGAQCHFTEPAVPVIWPLLCAEEEIPKWRAHLQHAGVEIESEIHWPQGGVSLYVRDPAGNSIELASSKIWGFQPD